MAIVWKNSALSGCRPIKIGVIVAIFLSLAAQDTFAQIKRQNGYYRNDGTYVEGSYRDISNDGYEYNNANYLGYNHKPQFNAPVPNLLNDNFRQVAPSNSDPMIWGQIGANQAQQQSNAMSGLISGIASGFQQARARQQNNQQTANQQQIDQDYLDRYTARAQEVRDSHSDYEVYRPTMNRISERMGQRIFQVDPEDVYQEAKRIYNSGQAY